MTSRRGARAPVQVRVLTRVMSHVLAALERHAVACGYRQLWLSTRRVNARAVAFYERHGYAPVAPYGRYVGRAASVCLGRRLP